MKALTLKKKSNYNPAQVIALCGSSKKKTAFSIVNYQLIKQIKKRKDYSVLSLESAVSHCNFSLDYFIHHDYTQNFNQVSVPDEAKFIAIRTWDFGKFPLSWAEKINRKCDQLWVHSRWIRKKAVESGIDSRRVKVIPHGIDEKIFKPKGKIYPLGDKSFKFIFVGAANIRKGIDILLEAYGKAFSPADDVSLVIKANSKDVFYSGLSYQSRIFKLIKDKGYPDLIYINKYLADEDLASLYRACDVGVFPYRAEGFAMPILEAMACGRPCIVPKFGACLDFCSQGNSFFMPVKRINVPVLGNFAINTLGFKEKVDEVDFCEVDAGTLALYLRKAFSTSKKILRNKSTDAFKTAQGKFTWSDTERKVVEQLKNLDDHKVPYRLKQKRRKHADNAQTFNIAKDLFMKAGVQ